MINFIENVFRIYGMITIYYHENCNGVNKIDPKLSVEKKNFAAVFI